MTDIWCGADASASDLVAASDMALRVKSRAVAVAPAHVHIVWAWMEGKGTEVFAVFQDSGICDPSKLAPEIHAVFKKGADGVILPWSADIAGALLPVRDDLFFGKKLFLSAFLGNIEPYGWAEIFNILKRVGADGIMLYAQAAKKQTDAVGRFYGMLENIDTGFSPKVSALVDSPAVMESMHRLAKRMRPDIAENLRFFIGHRA